MDDTAAMHEVLTRRFRRHVQQRGVGPDPAGHPISDPAADAIADRATDPTVTADVPGGIDPATGKPRRFAYAPQLVVVDGGLPQVNAAQAALDALGVDDVALVGLAKRLEEVWLPGEEFPVILPRGSEALFLLQRLRDEAHRFAITFHRQRRSKAMTASALDEIPGLGPARKAALLGAFGSVKAMRAAAPADLAAVPGIGPALAAVVAERLAAGAGRAAPAVNVITGEILD